MKKNNNRIWTFLTVILFISNSTLSVVIILALLSPLALGFPLLFPNFLVLAITNFGILYYINQKKCQDLARAIIRITFTFPVFYGFLSIITFVPFSVAMKMLPVILPREEVVKEINACNIAELTRNRSENGFSLFWYIPDRVQISFAEGKYPKGNYTVAGRDFDTLLDDARAVKNRCSYSFVSFTSSVKGFKKEYHSVYITLDEAAKMLNNCTPDTIVYSDLSECWDTTTGVPTGIMLWSKEKPWQIWVKEDLKAETFPIFREAKKKCPNLQISL